MNPLIVLNLSVHYALVNGEIRSLDVAINVRSFTMLYSFRGQNRTNAGTSVTAVLVERLGKISKKYRKIKRFT